MEERLAEAARLGSIDELYVILQRSPNILDIIDQIPLVDTPLHISASAGQTYFALEILRLKPSFGKKLNPDGFSALHLALRSNQFETVKRLVRVEPQLIRVQGREGFTPLHYMAEIETDGHGVDLLAQFLVACPGSIGDLTIYGETAVHVAVKNRRIKALRVLLGWLRRSGGGRNEILSWTDDKHRTLLHMAAINNEPEIMRLLVKKVRVCEKDMEGSTALDIVLRHPRGVNREASQILRDEGAVEALALSNTINMSEFLISSTGYRELILRNVYYMHESMSSEKRNVILGVAVLIMTTTYQGLLTGTSAQNFPAQDANIIMNPTISNDTSHLHLARSLLRPDVTFNMFITFNTIAFLLSATLTCLLLRFSKVLQLSLSLLLVSYLWRTLYEPMSTTTALKLMVWAVWLVFLLSLLSVKMISVSYGRSINPVIYQLYKIIGQVHGCRSTPLGSSH